MPADRAENQVSGMNYENRIGGQFAGMSAVNRRGEESFTALDRAGVIVYIAGIPTSSCQTE